MTELQHGIKVAVYDRFFDAFMGLPRRQQKKTREFLRKFREDPTGHARNLEKIHSFRDPNLRTARVDQDYRAIVLQPEQGNVFVLLWVDKHDAAMAWAQDKRIDIHPDTGALQVLEGVMVQAEESVPAQAVEAPLEAPEVAAVERATPLFEEWSDADLLGIGLPTATLPAVRALTARAGLDFLASSLPEEAWEGLCFLADGESLDEVRRALGVDRPAKVDPDDFAKALEQAVSQRRFKVLTDDDELVAMLDAPLERWRVFLHPSQRQLVDWQVNGPIRVLGGAGTGKTVVAMHRAAWLSRDIFNGPDDRVLFTTFTRNLAADIADNLDKLCGPEERGRIEVTHLDKWVADFLRREGYSYRIAYWRTGRGELWDMWRQALERAEPGVFPESFYREEWEHVVQPQGVHSWDEYKRARRVGRGIGLNRAQRRQAWPVFAEYRLLLDERRLREPEGAMRDAAALLQAGAQVPYRSVVVDEAQDMSTQAFRLLRAMIPEERPNDLFIVGDGHQRIYRRQVVLGQAGVNIVGRSRRLRVNYRTTEQIRRFAVALLQDIDIDDLDDGDDNTHGTTSLVTGEPPEVARCDGFEAECDTIATWVRQGAVDRTCLVARTNALRDQYGAAMAARGFEVYPLSREQAEDRGRPGLRLATMHRVKGLEFDRVVIAGLDDGVMPLRQAVTGTTDDGLREDAERMERCLFYVAATRARRALLLSCLGPGSGWLPKEGR